MGKWAKIVDFRFYCAKIRKFQIFEKKNHASGRQKSTRKFEILESSETWKTSKFCFQGQFWCPKTPYNFFFKNSKFSDFVGIKSDIHQYENNFIFR